MPDGSVAASGWRTVRSTERQKELRHTGQCITQNAAKPETSLTKKRTNVRKKHGRGDANNCTEYKYNLNQTLSTYHQQIPKYNRHSKMAGEEESVVDQRMAANQKEEQFRDEDRNGPRRFVSLRVGLECIGPLFSRTRGSGKGLGRVPPPPCASTAVVPQVRPKRRFNAHPVLGQGRACA